MMLMAVVSSIIQHRHSLLRDSGLALSTILSETNVLIDTCVSYDDWITFNLG